MRELKALGDVIVIESAGYSEEAAEGRPAAPEWAAMFRGTGIDLGSHRSRRIDGVGDLRRFDLIICVSLAAVAAVRDLGVDQRQIVLANPADGGISDPYGAGQQAYEECYRTILAATPHLVSAMRGISCGKRTN